MATTFPEHFERQYQSHLKHLKLKGLRPKTIEAYAPDMRRMGEYFSYQVDALSQDDLAEYFTDLLGAHSWSGVKLDLYGWKFFTEHVRPKGLRRSRNFGFLHPNSAGALRLLQLLHVRAKPPARPAATTAARPAWRCACGQPMIVLGRRMSAPVCGDSAMHPRAGFADVHAANRTTVANAGLQQPLQPVKSAAAAAPTMH